MRTKKKYAHGGVHKWPPDTEVAPASSTSVSIPQLNFLANQLLPAQVPSNIEAEMLNRQGVPAVSTQPKRPSAEYARTSNLLGINRSTNQTNREVEGLVKKGYSEATARTMVDKYYQDMRDQNKFQPGTVQSVAPLIDLTPAGDALALAGAAGKALEGKLGEAGVGAGLATAAVFFPGRIPADARADDMIRLMAARNEAAGAVPQGVSDIIEYIQEAATPGNISFGRTRSASLGGGPRVWREPMVDLPNTPGRNQGYLREAFTPPSPRSNLHGVDQPFESGRELGGALARTLSMPGGSGRTTQEQLRATSDVLDRFAHVGGNVADAQVDYYDGVIEGIRQGMPSAPNPPARRASTPSTGSAASGVPTKPQRQTLVFGDGDFALQAMINPSAIDNTPGSAGIVMKARNFDLGINMKMDGVRMSDGTIEYDFFLDSRNFESQPKFKNRVRDLENSGLSMEAAESAAKREVSENINKSLKKMYAEIPVGHSVSTTSYSTDSYPMFLNGISAGKYKVKASNDPMRMRSLNTMGAKDNLFRRWTLDSLGKENASKLRANQSFNDVAAEIIKSRPNASQAQVERDALLMIAKQDRVLRGFEGQDLLKIIQEGAVNHINEQIEQTNENAIQSLIRQAIQEAESKGTKISPQQAEIDVLNQFTPLEKSVLEYGEIRIPVPVSTKIRAEEGAFLPFKIKKKKAKGMRIKKGA